MKYLKFVLIILLFAVLTNCQKEEEEPGPISVQNIITPSTVNNGSTLNWMIKVNNMGNTVEIDRVHLTEEFISGWAQGQGTADGDLPITTTTVGKNQSTIIYTYSAPVYNTGATDLQVKNTVTVYSNGGTATDFVIYTITSDNKSANLNPKFSGIAIK